MNHQQGGRFVQRVTSGNAQNRYFPLGSLLPLMVLFTGRGAVGLQIVEVCDQCACRIFDLQNTFLVQRSAIDVG